MRLVIPAAALNSRAEIRSYELGGKGDFKPLAPVEWPGRLWVSSSWALLQPS